MLNVWRRAKKVEEMFGGMKNNLYLCIVLGSQIHTEMIKFGLTQIYLRRQEICGNIPLNYLL